MRASISQLGLFRVPHANTCEPFESVFQPVPSSFLKGIVALGALAGATTLANPVVAEENGGEVGIESETNLSTGLVGSDSIQMSKCSVSKPWPWICTPIVSKLWKSLGRKLRLKMAIWL